MIRIKAKFLTTHQDRMIGLLGQTQATPVYIKTRFGIHTIGMKFNIDVLVLNSQNRVVRMCRSLPPFRLFFWNPKYDLVLELPEKFINRHHVKLGDQISL